MQKTTITRVLKEPVEMPRPRAIQDTRDLRIFLVSSMVAAAAGKLEYAQTAAICNFAQQIYNTLNMELKMAAAKQRLGMEDIKPVDFE